jgi:hypothetical protein
MLYDDPARETYPHGNLNCGLAHGVPGILAFLALVRKSGLPAIEWTRRSSRSQTGCARRA